MSQKTPAEEIQKFRTNLIKHKFQHENS
jgi:hypothetical protein